MSDLNLAQECRANAKWEYNENGDTAIHTSLCKAADEIERLTARVAELDTSLEREYMRLAACGIAALGYHLRCADEYKSASLEDVLRLREQIDALRKQEPHHWIVPDFGFLFPSKESAKSYLTNIESGDEPTACYTHAPPAAAGLEGWKFDVKGSYRRRTPDEEQK